MHILQLQDTNEYMCQIIYIIGVSLPIGKLNIRYNRQSTLSHL